MSQAINPHVIPVKTLDPKMRFSEYKSFGVIESGVQAMYQAITSNSSSDSNIQANIQPPAPNIAMSREILCRVTFRVTLTGTAGSGTGGLLLYDPVYDCPRSAPLARITTAAQSTINSGSVQQVNFRAIDPILHCNISDRSSRTSLTTGLNFPDFYQEYNDAWTTGNGIAVDPMAKIGQNSYYQPRGAWDITVVSNGPTSAVLEFTTIEPLYLSPFLKPCQDDTAFINVQTLTVTLTLGNLSRVWSHNNTNSQSGRINPVTGISVTIPTDRPQPAFLVQYITPQPTVQIPPVISYDYFNWDIYTTDVGAVAANTQLTTQTNNIQLSNIPRRLILFVRERDSDRNCNTSDVFARIDNISVNFDNRQLLSAATTEQLYQISVEAGLEMSWQQYKKYTGSIVILDLGRSLQLSNLDEASGVAATKQLQITITFTNINSSRSINESLYIIAVSDGLMTISPGIMNTQNSLLSAVDVINAKSPSDELEEIADLKISDNASGGSIMGHTKRFFQKAGKNISHVGKQAGKHLYKGIKDAELLSRTLQFVPGVNPGVINELERAGLGMSGGAYSGGKMMTKKQLLMNARR